MTIKVLIVDDSAFFRRRLSEIIDADPRLEVVGTALNGQDAITQTRHFRPDVITMDIEMPVMDGISAVQHIMRDCPTPVLMLSTWTTAGAKATLDALEAGAMDFQAKRFDELTDDKVDARQKLCERIYLLATHAKLKRIPNLPKPPPVILAKSHTNWELVVIGTSTGGPVALQKVLSQLPAQFPYPILLLQHMPGSFTPSFADRLNQQCQITVKQAEHGDLLRAGTALLAPGGKQLQVTGRVGSLSVVITDGSPTDTYRPCIDNTLTSISQICPSTTLAIILTGMGTDGCDGSKQLSAAGGTIWAQDEQTSTIYGMPMAIARAGIASKILSLNDIGSKLAAL
ncbi:Chemotaxis response regulator protein-glutamate methylesterase CheB [Methylophaga frappieri]|uniref:Protein-glutamate methylesterase/protein-glutamine glutaminase n=1 Tax=Methylophaga frappieri (strain ATCC BAA-2434 / DSM 25690 / JAM7) TaxID=754477 RepID=I1YHM5_METFJ|nr:chemotaxis response regulator protein-glutamate methylesterase [Methylophaga frappieri]AFJ02418.1 Chemotaxis response regulator protein-glutamate methylesterase CheB [Methylophaga frappieri]